MRNPLKLLKVWLSRTPSETEPSPQEPAQLAVRTSFRSDLSTDGGEEDGDSTVISEEEWDIQERTRERIRSMRESHSANDVLQDGEGEARDGEALDWEMATSDEWEEELGRQKAAWLDRGAHHMGSPSVPLLPPPEDAKLAGCGRLILAAGCEWVETMVRAGTVRPKVVSGSRITLEVESLGIAVSVDLLDGGARFSVGDKEFDADELQALLSKNG